ncbi:MAG: hypothetical protein AABX77_02340, partial [Nanoarchaeota archaeon]
MKRGSGILILSVILFVSTILSMQIISAQVSFLDNFIERTGEAFGSILGPIFDEGYGDILFARVLFFFLLFAIIFTVIGRSNILGENLAIQSVVAAIVSILSVRYITPDQFINAILLPYGALGIALSILLPLIIFFLFLHTNQIGGFGRRAAWFIYLVSFLLLWGTRDYAD